MKLPKKKKEPKPIAKHRIAGFTCGTESGRFALVQTLGAGVTTTIDGIWIMDRALVVDHHRVQNG